MAESVNFKILLAGVLASCALSACLGDNDSKSDTVSISDTDNTGVSRVSDSNIYLTEQTAAVSSFDRNVTRAFNSYALISTDKLGNGQGAKVQFWPGVLDTEDCTAALVGPNTILTAAHCIDDASIDVPPEYTAAYLKWGTERFPLICKMNPDYVAHGKPSNPLHRRGPEDHALCHIALAGGINSVGLGLDAVSTEYVYEVIDLSGRNLTEGTDLLMVGFGCEGGQPLSLIHI